MQRAKGEHGFYRLGSDIKSARKALGISRRELAEAVGIDPRYLANIENSGSLPSLPVFWELVKLCRLPVELYFYPEAQTASSDRRLRIRQKLDLCPDAFLPVIEGAIDGALNAGSTAAPAGSGDRE